MRLGTNGPTSWDFNFSVLPPCMFVCPAPRSESGPPRAVHSRFPFGENGSKKEESTAERGKEGGREKKGERSGAFHLTQKEREKSSKREKGRRAMRILWRRKRTGERKGRERKKERGKGTTMATTRGKIDEASLLRRRRRRHSWGFPF